MSKLKPPSLHHFLSAIFLAAALAFIPAPPAGAEISCGALTCTCKGDAECNDMFTNRCSEAPSSCTQKTSGDDATCTCFKKASTTAPPKDRKGPAAVGGLKKSN